jgi:hypothetical protein
MNQKQLKEYALNVLKGFNAEYVGYSDTNGQSMYFKVDGVKIRFSDHAVTNLDRVQNEIHFDLKKIGSDWSNFNVEQRLLELRYRLGDKTIKYGKRQILMPSGKYLEAFGYSQIETYSKGGGVTYKDLTKIPNYNNVYKGAEYYSFSEDVDKQSKADKWFELFRTNQKERLLTKNEFDEFMDLSNELAWEDFEKGGVVTYKDKYNTKYGYKKNESHTLEEISKDTGVSMKGLQQIYNKGIGAYKTNPTSVRPNVKSKEQWAMARVYSSVMGGKASKIDANELKMQKGGLIAPNGKKSNLTALQYKLVRTPEFKAWFGDWENDPKNASKVVDENGEPLVCYHTSDKKFTKFDYELSYDGAIWFTSSIEKIKDNETGASGSGIIYEVFLNIKKIGNWDDYDKGIAGLLRDKFNGAKMDDDYIVFEPNQIKLADGTNTTFDGSNPDIRFEDGGQITSYTEFYDNLIIEDGSKYIGQKFNDVFPFLSRSRKTPHFFRLKVEQYEGEVERLKQDNYTTPSKKTRDFNKLEAHKKNIDKDKYLSRFYLDSKGTIIKFMKNDKMEKGGSVQDLINQGVLDLKMFDTTPEHAKLYGFDSVNPLYIQSIHIIEIERLKGKGTQVLKYIDDYAIENGHDVIFGHITQKSEPSIDVIKNILRKNGYSTIEGNNDFYKYIDSNKRFKNGGMTNEKTIRVNVEYLEEQFFELNKEMDIPISVYKQYEKTGKVPREFLNDLTSETGESNWVETNPISVSLTPIKKMNDGGKVSEKEQTQDFINQLKSSLPFLDKEGKASVKELIESLESAIQYMDDEDVSIEESKDEIKNSQLPYLMTLDEYKESGIIELLKDYQKFVRKNQKRLLANDYSLADYMTLEEYLELGEQSPLYSKRDIMGRPNIKNVEETIKEYFLDRKTYYGQKPNDYQPATKEVVEQNKKYRERLLKHFPLDKYERIRVESDELKSNKRAVKNAMDNMVYYDLLKSGKLSIERLEDITSSVGVRITKDTLRGDRTAEFKDYISKTKVPQQSYEAIVAFANKVKADLKPIMDEVYEKEFNRYETLLKESVGRTMKAKNMVYVPNMIFMLQVKPLADSEYEILALKPDYKEDLKNIVSQEVEDLTWNIIKAMSNALVYFKIPLKSFERIFIRRGAKGFEGAYKMIFEDGSSLVVNTTGIGAGGYNIQRFHYRYITSITDMTLPNGQKTKDDSHFKEYRITTFEDGGWMQSKFAEGGKITQFEIQSMRNYINSPNPNPKLKESFEKVLRKFGVDVEQTDISNFPQGKFVDTYDFAGYEYMRNINEEAGVHFLLTGEYQLVSKAIFEKDYSMWMFYNYLGRINISFQSCLEWLREASDYFSYTLPVPIYLVHTPKAKDGRSYAQWYSVSNDYKIQAEGKIGRPITFEFNDRWYYNEIGMVANGDADGGWGTKYKEKKTGLLLPEYMETSFHFNTLIHEFAHCLDFQTQLVENIEKYQENKDNIEPNLNFGELERALYLKQIQDKPKEVSQVIGTHFDTFVNALIRTLRACASGHIPVTQLYEQQAIDVQTALSGTYGDLLLAQRERREQERKDLQVANEIRDNKRFTWQGYWNREMKNFLIENAIQEGLKNKLETNTKEGYTLPEIIELDNMLSNYMQKDLYAFISMNPSKAQERADAIKEMRIEANRIINNHYDNVKKGFEYGYQPKNEVEMYLFENCRLQDYRDYKSWKECSKQMLTNFR